MKQMNKRKIYGRGMAFGLALTLFCGLLPAGTVLAVETDLSAAAEQNVAASVSHEAKNAAAVVAKGNCGPGGKSTATWSLDADGVLTISGKGALDAYSEGGSSGGVVTQKLLPPWYTYRESIRQLVVNSGITEITPIAFQDCTNLTSVSLPEGLTTIGSMAFRRTSLTSITFPKTLKNLDVTALFEVPITEVKVNIAEGSNEEGYYMAVDNVLYTNTGKTLVYMPPNRTGTFKIPKSVKTGANVKHIGTKAFSNSALTEVTFPTSLLTVKSYAFQMSAIESVDLSNPKVVTLEEGAFANCHNLKSAVISDAVTSLPHTFTWDENLTSVTIGSGVTEMEGTFRGCTSLASVKLPTGLQTIGWGTFAGCTKLSAIALPGKLQTIGEQAFQGCPLTAVTLPASLVRIGDAAFYQTKLKSVTVPASVQTIGISAFPSGCALAAKAALTKMGDGSQLRSDLAVSFKLEMTPGQDKARKLLSLINEFRTGSDAWVYDTANKKVTLKGLKALKYDYALEKIAMQRAAEIALNFSHTRPDGSSCFTLSAKDDNGNRIISAAENISSGYTTYQKAMEGLKENYAATYADQAHRRNLLASDFTAVGIGHVVYNGTHYWVQEFGYTKSQTAKTTAVKTKTKFSFLTTTFSDQVNLLKVTVPSSVKLGIKKKAALPKAKVTIRFASGVYAGITFNKKVTWSKPSNTKVVTIKSEKLNGKKAGSATISATLYGKKLKSTVTVLKTPKLSSVKKGKNKITVKWKSVKGAVKYRVYRKVGNGKWKKLADTKKLKYVDKKVKYGKKYTYTVCCISKDGKTIESAYNTKGKKITYK